MKTTRRTPASSAARSTFSVPATFTERIDPRDAWIGSAAAACTTTSAPATSLRDAVAIADVAAQLLDGALELGVVQWDDVERPYVMPVGEQPSSKVQAEKARAAGDGPEHLRVNATRRRRRGRRPNRRLRIHEHRGGEQHRHPDHALAQETAAQTR